MFKTTLACVVAVAAMGASSAQAVPGNTGGYPRFAYEGMYPDQTPCLYHLQQVRMKYYRLQIITLKYFYSRRCGSFARIENAPANCIVYLTRSAAPGRGVGATVWETVDPGIDFAYTKVANNLNGRTSRAALACGNGPALVTTTWF